MKILSWNVNSVRIRLTQLLELILSESPDVICLQETKVENQSFPLKEFRKRGYHIFLNGISSYNGVCILSKENTKNFKIENFCGKNDGRHIQIKLKDLNIHSIYIPAGGDEPDPKINKKFEHKLLFLDELLKWSIKKKKTKNIVCGDFNIAPYPDDVWSHKSLRNVVSHTEIEREKLINILKKGSWVDSIRKFINPPNNIFTWWSYRSKDFTKNNRGRRLDHIWSSDKESIKLKNAKILSHTRKLVRPSDHVPILLELAL